MHAQGKDKQQAVRGDAPTWVSHENQWAEWSRRASSEGAKGVPAGNSGAQTMLSRREGKEGGDSMTTCSRQAYWMCGGRDCMVPNGQCSRAVPYTQLTLPTNKEGGEVGGGGRVQQQTPEIRGKEQLQRQKL